MKQRRREDDARRAAAQAAARAKRLDQLATRTEEAWAKVAEWIGTSMPTRSASGSALRVQHERKPTRQERFDRAGLPG